MKGSFLSIKFTSGNFGGFVKNAQKRGKCLEFLSIAKLEKGVI